MAATGVGRHVLVTGGVGDIGLATALRLATDGHTVTAVDVVTDDDGASRLDEACTDATVRARLAYRRADVTDRDALDALVGSLDRLDVAIANAGVVRSAAFLDVTPEQWDAHLAVNLTGAFHTAQAAARRFVAEGTRGVLLFTGSWVGAVPWPEITAYTVTKAGLVMLARQAARELASHGIRANVVAPGIVDAGMARVQLRTEPQYAARAGRVVPLGTLQTAEQVAAAFSFLCSPDADYVTGATLLVDGGASLFAFD